MKKNLILIAALSGLALAGCASNSGAPAVEGTGGSNAVSTPAEEAPAPEPLDLTGEWKQTNSNSADSYQAATISGDTITVNWMNDAESTTALYWVGTYIAPTDAADTYSWTSARDVAQTESAILASGDDAKEFTYTGGRLTYNVTALGVTKTVELEKQ